MLVSGLILEKQQQQDYKVKYKLDRLVYSLQALNVCTVFFCRRILSSLFFIAATLYGPIVSALSDDANKPIHVHADQAEMDQVNGIVNYNGNVQVDQGTLRLIAEKIIVEYEDQKVTRIIATGSPARYKQVIDEEGNEVKANSDKIIYFTKNEIIELIGNSYLWENNNEINGSVISYYIREGKVNAESEENKPVKMILQPHNSVLPKK